MGSLPISTTKNYLDSGEGNFKVMMYSLTRANRAILIDVG
jgi:hypothetical protein